MRRWEYRERTRRRAADRSRLPDPDNARRLARELMAADADLDPAGLEAVGFANACGRLDLDPDAAAAVLVDLATDVTVRTGPGEFEAAAEWADRNWHRFCPVVGCPHPAAKAGPKWRDRARVAGLVYRLGKHTSDGFALVPVVPVARWLPSTDDKAGRVLRELAGVVKGRPPVIRFRTLPGGRTHSWKGGQAREAEYVGPRPS